MKLHKLISRTVVATSILGATFGGLLSSGTSVNAQGNEQLNNRITDRSYDKSSQGSNSGKTQADITSGLLTLNAVPSLNFGNNDNSNSNHTQLHLMDANSSPSNNINGDNQDGNSDNLLSVTDYRQTHQNGNDNGGWEVNAQLSNFTNVSDSTLNDGQYNPSNQWNINLNTNNNMQSDYHPNNYNRYDDSNNSNNTANYPPTIYNNVNLSSNSSGASVMGTKNNYTNGHGITNVNYGNLNTSLTTPYNVQPGKYTATVTWTLSANPNSANN